MGLRQSKNVEVEGAATGACTGAVTSTTTETTETKEPMGAFLSSLKTNCAAIKATRKEQASAVVATTVQKITDLLDSQPFRDKIAKSAIEAVLHGSKFVCAHHIPCTDVGLIGTEFRDVAPLIIEALTAKYPFDLFPGFYFFFHTFDRALCPEFIVHVHFKLDRRG